MSDQLQRSPEKSTSPLVRWVVRATVPPQEREYVLGDLEELRAHAHATRAPWRGRLWYARQVLSLVMSRWPTPRRELRPRRDALMPSLLWDLRLTLRSLARAPLFAAVTVAILAIGIGSATALFSVVYPVLFAAPPYDRPDQLVLVGSSSDVRVAGNVGFLTYVDLLERSRSFSGAVAMASWTPTLQDEREAVPLLGQRVSHTYFRLLGVRPMLGRDFRPEEDRYATRTVAMLSHGLWQRRFGGDPAVVNRTVTINGLRYLIVGVLPASFENLTTPNAEIWAPLGYDASLEWACRSCQHLRMLARLKDGVTRDEAIRDMARIVGQLRTEFPADYGSSGIGVQPLREAAFGGVAPVFRALLGAVVLLLTIACVNVASLVLGRAIERGSEFTVRSALGASFGRLVRPVVWEAFVVAGIGASLGVALAAPAVRLVPTSYAAALPRSASLGVDGRAVAFAGLVALICAVVAGVVPVLVALRRGLAPSIRGEARHLVRAPGQSLRSGLVGAEIALALVLLTGAGLLIRSVQALLRVDTGFDPRGVVTMGLSLTGPRFDDSLAVITYDRRALEAALSVPGVTHAAMSSQLPLGGNFDAVGAVPEGTATTDPDALPSPQRFVVTEGYLQTMKIPVIGGRAFTAADRSGSEPVVMINVHMKEALYGAVDPVGRRVRVAGGDTWRTIVGVVGDVKHLGLDRPQEMQLYLPLAQNQQMGSDMNLELRTTADVTTTTSSVLRALRAIDPSVALANVRDMDQVVRDSTAQRRLAGTLLVAFAVVALVLAATGLFGVISASVSSRTRELGLRCALGATRDRIIRLVLRQGFVLIAGGLAAGLGGALLFARALRALLFGVAPSDPLTLVATALLLLSVALVACLLPAWRASRVDPAIALRSD